MAEASINLKITSTAPDEQTAAGLLHAGLVRFVRSSAGIGVSEDFDSMEDAELVSRAQVTLRAFIEQLILADVANQAEIQKQQAVNEARQATAALGVEASI